VPKEKSPASCDAGPWIGVSRPAARSYDDWSTRGLKEPQINAHSLEWWSNHLIGVGEDTALHPGAVIESVLLLRWTDALPGAAGLLGGIGLSPGSMVTWLGFETRPPSGPRASYSPG